MTEFLYKELCVLIKICKITKQFKKKGLKSCEVNISNSSKQSLILVLNNLLIRLIGNNTLNKFRNTTIWSLRLPNVNVDANQQISTKSVCKYLRYLH